jgi:hypothetical protein
MSRWATVIEACHSSLLDELIDRQWNYRPELGLPIRASSLDWPSPTVLEALLVPVFGEPPGFLALALDPPAIPGMGIAGVGDLWESVSRRLPKELEVRKIRLRFGVPCQVSREGVGGPLRLPNGAPAPTRVIWIPIGVEGGGCYLGFAL